MPDFTLEDAHGGLVCGLDEVGRGPLAGPVVAACVYISAECRTLPFIGDIKDSKKLRHPKRLSLDALIRQHCAWGIGQCEPEEIDAINILQASLKAMERAYAAMNAPADLALIDGNRLPKSLPCAGKAVVKGDGISTSIAAASIVAKVHRDKIMGQLAAEFPQYGWERNAAYPTAEHLAAIQIHGVTPHHRRSFGPVRNAMQNLKSGT